MDLTEPLPADGVAVPVMQNSSGPRSFRVAAFTRNNLNPRLVLFDDHVEFNIIREHSLKYSEIREVQLVDGWGSTYGICIDAPRMSLSYTGLVSRSTDVAGLMRLFQAKGVQLSGPTQTFLQTGDLPSHTPLELQRAGTTMLTTAAVNVFVVGMGLGLASAFVAQLVTGEEMSAVWVLMLFTIPMVMGLLEFLAGMQARVNGARTPLVVVSYLQLLMVFTLVLGIPSVWCSFRVRRELAQGPSTAS